MTSITIPNSVISIGNSAFYGCSGLTSITIPNSVTSIGSSAFKDCTGLTKLILEDGTESISGLSFPSSPIETLYLGRNTSDTFVKGKTTLKEVTIGNSITSIGESAFKDCTSLTKLILEDGAESISGLSFPSSPIETLYLGRNTSDTFVKGKTTLKEVTIGNSVTSIGSSAFSHCSGLTSVTIPNSVTSIGSWAFDGCTGLTEVNITDLSAWCKIDFGGYSANPLYYANKLKLNGSEITNLVIPNDITEIKGYAFNKCTGLTSITIPNSVTSIGYYAFSGCSNLYSLTIGSSISSIPSNAFSVNPKKTIWLTNTPPSGYSNVAGTINYVANDQYSSLSNVKVYPYLSSMFEVDGVKYVPVSPSERTCDAIDCSYNLTDTIINIGNTVFYKGVAMAVKKINPYICYGNSHIKECKIDYNGNILDYAFCGCSAIETITLGEGLGKIGYAAFSGCSKLKEVVIPNSATSLGESAFYSCSSITSATIGNAVENINVSTFNNCKSLENIIIGTGVKSIGSWSFYGCSALPIIEIPKNVTSIGDYAFDNCSNLSDVIIEDRSTILTLGSNGSSPMFSDCPLDSVYIGGDISYKTTSSYGYSPFYNNKTLRAVTITDKETEISDNEFYGCANLKSVSIGDGVETIGKYAFSGCASLESFAFGSSMKTIGEEAFSDCTALVKLRSKAMTPPVCGTQALDDINKWNCELYVPRVSISAYQAADQWKEFFFMYDGVEGVKIDCNAIEVSRYDIHGRLLSEPTRGINIVKMSDGTTRKEIIK